MRGISREVLARDAAWSLADGSCKHLTVEWARWEATYAASLTASARQAALTAPAALCAACPIATECADLAERSGYTGIAAGRAYRNGRLDHPRHRQPATAKNGMSTPADDRSYGGRTPHGESIRARRHA